MVAVKLLTIGEFAQATRLSPKALRLYDELGLLRPFRVDEWSGYRYYAPSQLERARLVAWLRRLGMSLAQIGAVVESPPAEAAAAVAAFLRLTEADFEERQRLALFLITYLSEGATAMPEPVQPAPSTPAQSPTSPAPPLSAVSPASAVPPPSATPPVAPMSPASAVSPVSAAFPVAPVSPIPLVSPVSAAFPFAAASPFAAGCSGGAGFSGGAGSGAPLVIRYAAASDIGRVRKRNQDIGYAGPRLLAVADGFGPAGDAASAAVIDALRHLESAPSAPASAELAAAGAGDVPVTGRVAGPGEPVGLVPAELSQPGAGAGDVPVTGRVAGPGETAGLVPADLLNVLSDAVSSASASVRSIAESDPDLAGSGSTLTAMLVSGSRLALVHIGDTRAYLFRDGSLFQITHDHSVTQSMIDTGRLTPEEAASHPQRSLLLKAVGFTAADALGSGMTQAQADLVGTPDLSLLDAQGGDRYLLTSDGLTSVVPVAAIRETLSDAALSPEDVVRALITLANEAGGPDNIALAVADVTVAG